MKTIFLKGLCGLSLVMIPEAVLSSSKDNLKSVSPHQYTHLIETYQSQTFEPLSQTALFPEQSALNNSYKTAGVYFITNGKEQVFGSTGNDNTFNDPTGEYCARYGFEVTSCASGLFNKACPYNDKIYDKCCDASYKYTKSQCSAPKKLSADTCGDKYQCYCDASTYPYTSCDSPKIKGSACTDDSGTRYATCVCPTNVVAPYGCETYYASPCNAVCQKAYADNCRNRESVQTPYGCEKYFADCGTKCEKAYTDNCRNRTAVSAPYGCESYYADCSSKCETAYGDNCRNRTAVSSSKYGCEKYFADCSSKCEKAYDDNCHNQVAVLDTCPDDVTCTYFSDCKSKIKDWKCKSYSSEYCQKTETGCFCVGDIVYGDGTVKGGSLIAGKTPVAVVLNIEKRLAMSLTYVKKDGTPGAEEMLWSSGEGCAVPNKFYHGLCSTCDVPTYQDSPHYVNNCTDDGSVVTNQILAATCNGTPYAAKACNAYQPTGCTADFCKKGKWFLGSYTEYNHNESSLVETGCETAGGYAHLPEGKDVFWTSTGVDKKQVWIKNGSGGFSMYKNSVVGNLKYYTRPLVKF